MRLALALAAALLAATPAAAQPAEPLFAAVDAYGLLQDDVSSLPDVDITTGDAVDLALERAARHEPEQVAQGWLAYGALTAAQSPAFVAGVRSRVSAASRAAVLRQLRRDLTYARRRPPGSAEATQLILNAFAADAARLSAASARYNAIGQSLDASTWGAQASREERNARLRTMAREQRSVASELAPRLHVAVLGAQPVTNADTFGGRRFWDALANRQSTAPASRTLEPRSQDAVDRMLTLAALYIVNATPAETARVSEIMQAPRVAQCLAMAQLQFRQCASVAHDPNEDALCLARHGLEEVGGCLAP